MTETEAFEKVFGYHDYDISLRIVAMKWFHEGWKARQSTIGEYIEEE